jgi:hypothetical protein
MTAEEAAAAWEVYDAMLAAEDEALAGEMSARR